MIKRCSKCHETKPLSDFYKNKSKADGHTSDCKLCRSVHEKDAIVDAATRDRRRVIRAKSRAKRILIKRDQYNASARSRRSVIVADPVLGPLFRVKKQEKDARSRARNLVSVQQKERLRSKAKRLNPDYAVKAAEAKKKWKEKNKERLLATNRAYDRLQMATNLQRRLSKNLRGRLSKAIKAPKRRSVSALQLVGCSIQGLRLHLENQFRDGMAWDNYGVRGWHIDHKRPLATFDLASDEAIAEAFHYTNLQPLWYIDNIRKGRKLYPWIGRPDNYEAALDAVTGEQP